MTTIPQRLRYAAKQVQAVCVGLISRRVTEELEAIAAELESAPAADAEMPAYGNIPWGDLIEAVCEAQTGNPKVGWERDQSYYIGHQPVSVNMNSLNRIVSKFVAASAVAAVARELVAAWIATQRNEVPATGEEFAATIRSMKT